MANKAYKFRLYPNKEQEIMFTKTFGCVRFIYNKMLADKIEYYKETKQKLNNTPAQYKKEFEWLKEVDSLALANAQMNLQTAYNNFFRTPKVYLHDSWNYMAMIKYILRILRSAVATTKLFQVVP